METVGGEGVQSQSSNERIIPLTWLKSNMLTCGIQKGIVDAVEIMKNRFVIVYAQKSPPKDVKKITYMGRGDRVLTEYRRKDTTMRADDPNRRPMLQQFQVPDDTRSRKASIQNWIRNWIYVDTDFKRDARARQQALELLKTHEKYEQAGQRLGVAKAVDDKGYVWRISTSVPGGIVFTYEDNGYLINRLLLVDGPD